MPQQELTRRSGLTRMGLYKLRYGISRPHPKNEAGLRGVAVDWLRGQHITLGYSDPDRLPSDDQKLLAMYRHVTERDERRQHAKAETKRAKRALKRELYAAIKALGGIGRHRDGDLAEEYRRFPKALRNPRGVAPDEMADMLVTNYPWLGIRDENELCATVIE